MDIRKAREIMKIRIEEIPKDIKEIFEMCDAYWVYQGEPNEPHALLASGLHSDGYINVNVVTQFSNLRKFLAREIALKLLLEQIGDIDIVLSSSYAGISIGQTMADALRAISVFTEKEGEDQKWTGRFELPEEACVLQGEDLTTTLGTPRKVKGAVLKSNPTVKFVGKNGKTVVATIVHRPSKLPIEYPDYEIIALMEVEIHSWTPDECPLCKEGSEALKPKPNWQRFLEHR